MNEETINHVLWKMSDHLDNSQMVKLRSTLEESLQGEEEDTPEKSSEELLDLFLTTKRLEGRSEKTLRQYRITLSKLFECVGKNVCVMNTEDIRVFLMRYQAERAVTKATIDNIRRTLSSYFKWLEDENYIYKSPMRRIHKIKTILSIKETYADEDLERLRDDCEELRNLAIIDILNSTGMRVGELERLDINDVDFDERECIVLGKGEKERVVYFDARTKLHLMKYLASRTDSEPALFVSIRRPYKRLHASGVQSMLKKAGTISNVGHVHPHKFRRTMATTAIDRGMPIEQVQRLLGHEKIDTTLNYAMVKQSNVKMAHKKLMS
ncbi:MAG: tyrosine-type recombinase/integrase [Lachnospiraceae bacterium]|nr:tyrosine-type recombinase/integrase [Lachnospiraceae bacterium]